jgi:hypothetical protein
MPESMRKEMEKAVNDAAGERLQPTQYTRKEQALRASQSGSASASNGIVTEKAKADPLAKDSQIMVGGNKPAVCHYSTIG